MTALTSPSRESNDSIPFRAKFRRAKNMRRDFALPEDDLDGLNASGLEWETVRNGQSWLLVHEFRFPKGYNHEFGSVAIQIPVNYPVAQLDMAYFFPRLTRLDGGPLRQADVLQPIDGKQWQRWS